MLVVAALSLTLSGCSGDDEQSASTPAGALASATASPSAAPTAMAAPSARASTQPSTRSSTPATGKPGSTPGTGAVVPTPAPSVVETKPPAPEIERTLCALTRPGIEGLLGPAGAGISADQRVRLAAEALDESIATWRFVQGRRPEIRPQVDTAARVLSGWQAAVRAYDGGQAAAAKQALGQADAALEKLPTTPPAGVTGCPS
jgi:hypothetical protein